MNSEAFQSSLSGSAESRPGPLVQGWGLTQGQNSELECGRYARLRVQGLGLGI